MRLGFRLDIFGLQMNGLGILSPAQAQSKGRVLLIIKEIDADPWLRMTTIDVSGWLVAASYPKFFQDLFCGLCWHFTHSLHCVWAFSYPVSDSIWLKVSVPLPSLASSFNARAAQVDSAKVRLRFSLPLIAYSVKLVLIEMFQPSARLYACALRYYSTAKCECGVLTPPSCWPSATGVELWRLDCVGSSYGRRHGRAGGVVNAAEAARPRRHQRAMCGADRRGAASSQLLETTRRWRRCRREAPRRRRSR